MKTILANDKGFSLIEILVSSLVIGVGIIGLALMFSTGNTWVVAKGDDRVALGLALQRIEHYRQMSVDLLVAPGKTCSEGICPGGTLESAGPSGQWEEFTALDPAPARVPPGARSFVRETCVQAFDPQPTSDDANVRNNLNADNPYTADCLPGDPATQPARRITVIVTPTQAQGDPVVVQAWLQ